MWWYSWVIDCEYTNNDCILTIADWMHYEYFYHYSSICYSRSGGEPAPHPAGRHPVCELNYILRSQEKNMETYITSERVLSNFSFLVFCEDSQILSNFLLLHILGMSTHSFVKSYYRYILTSMLSPFTFLFYRSKYPRALRHSFSVLYFCFYHTQMPASTPSFVGGLVHSGWLFASTQLFQRLMYTVVGTHEYSVISVFCFVLQVYKRRILSPFSSWYSSDSRDPYNYVTGTGVQSGLHAVCISKPLGFQLCFEVYLYLFLVIPFPT